MTRDEIRLTRDEIRRLIATIKHYPTCRCGHPHHPGDWWCNVCEHPIDRGPVRQRPASPD